MHSGNGVLFESLYINHIKNCALRKENNTHQMKNKFNSHKNCFCEKYGNVDYD